MSPNTVPHIVSVEWLQKHLGDTGLVVVDATCHNDVAADGSHSPVSGYAQFLEEHIPGAVFADLLGAFAESAADRAWAIPPSGRFAKAAGALGIGAGVHVVVYDQQDGTWASRFWRHLRLEGFAAVSTLNGGLQAWRAARSPVTSGPPTCTPNVFVPRRRPGLIRSTAEVFAALDDESTVLVNTLDEATYRGESAGYVRRGHIPGSINIPVSGLRSPSTGRVRPIVDLRREFTAAGLLDPGKTVVTYCGGGIAATGLAHALALCGRDDVAVYAGSIRAWSARLDLPLIEGPHSY
ncbi:rhodanese-like domain-containing protein [Nocardia sp. NPDC050799]|uniref:sulfurtransferase n=1 Tax=Nocardia sp. NPDC050799 TaxID=3154842 RepID=UPI0033F41F9D